MFGAANPYLLQKNKELKLKIADQKREAYSNFLRNFTQTAVAIMHDDDVSGKGCRPGPNVSPRSTAVIWQR